MNLLNLRSQYWSIASLLLLLFVVGCSRKVREKTASENAGTSKLIEQTTELLPALEDVFYHQEFLNHFKSKKDQAESLQKKYDYVLREGGQKPAIVDVLRKGQDALIQLGVNADPGLAGDHANLESTLASWKNGLLSLEREKSAAQTRIKNLTEKYDGEFKQEERKFLAEKNWSEERKKRAIEGLRKRHRYYIGPARAVLGGINQKIDMTTREIAALTEKVANSAEQVAASRSEKLKSYIDALNQAATAMHAAGLPDDFTKHEAKRMERFEAIYDSLKQLEKQVPDGPPEPSSKGLHYIGGITHLVNGSEYYVDNRIVHIPAKYKDVFIGRHAGPNQYALRGAFRFVKNGTGQNKFGVNINIEYYDCDPVFSDAKLASLEHRRKIRPYLKHFDSIRHYQEFEKVKFKFDPIQKVFESILGKSVVEECQKKAKARFTKALAARTAWKEVTAPVEKNTKGKTDNVVANKNGNSNPKREESTKSALKKDQSKVEPATQLAKGSESTKKETSAPSSDVQDSGKKNSPKDLVPDKSQSSVPKTNLKKKVAKKKPLIPDVETRPKGAPLKHPLYLMRTKDGRNWHTAVRPEAENLVKTGHWQKGEVLGNVIGWKAPRTVPLVRWKGPKGGTVYSFRSPDNKKTKFGVFGWVWKEKREGLIEVYALKNKSDRWQLTRVAKHRDTLIKKHGWKLMLTFYMLPPEN